MNYEQKYKEALERAMDLMTNQNPPAFDKDLISLVFPELDESEDKKIWKDAQGDDLPPYDKEVIVLRQAMKGAPEYLEVSFAHRPDPKEYVVVGGKRLFAKVYGNGGWNLRNIKYWLDVELPNEIEL